MASAEYQKERRRQRRLMVHGKSPKRKHGTNTMYNRGCHCTLCRAAHAKYYRERIARLQHIAVYD